MIHGGTNFGFTSGANYNKDFDIQPDLTSYDYDAPISESGWATPKYNALREIFQKINQTTLPEVPKPPKVITIPAIEFTKINSLFDLIDKKKPVTNDQPLTFEDLNIGNGYVIYRRQFDNDQKGLLNIKGLRDYANIYVNGVWKGEMNRINKKYDIEIDLKTGDRLDIVVENMGRINYGAEIVHNLKGIIEPIRINGNIISGNWQMFSLPFDQFPKHTYQKKILLIVFRLFRKQNLNWKKPEILFWICGNLVKGLSLSTVKISGDTGAW